MAISLNYHATDTGTGTLSGGGSVNYATGFLSLSPHRTAVIPLAEYVTSKIGTRETGGGQIVDTYRNSFRGYRYAQVPATFLGGNVKVRYFTRNNTDAHSAKITFAPEIDLTEGYNEAIAPGSVLLDFAGGKMSDASGALVYAIERGIAAGTRAGVIDYASGLLKLEAWTESGNTGTVVACLTTAGALPVEELHFRVGAAPIRPGSLSIKYNLIGDPAPIIVRAATDGSIIGDGVEGKVDAQTGVVHVRFGRWVTVTDEIRAQPWYRDDAVENGRIWQYQLVQASSLTYGAVAYTYIPLNKDIIGVDTVRLPLDGKVPIFRPGDVAVVHHAQSAALPAQANATAQCGRGNLSRVWVYDEGNTAGGTIPGGVRVPSTQYDANLDTGIVTLTDASGLTGPLRVEHRIEDVVMISETDVSGGLKFSRPLAHDYPAGSGVSSALIAGDLFARASQPFDQRTWTEEWSDVRIGNQVSAEYNSTLYPIEVDNMGAITERWALIFTSTSTVRVVGEACGQIESGLPIADNIAPINPVTGRPYFTVRAQGFGSGWATGNVIRFNTTGAQAPIWIARTVQQGQGIQGADGFRIQIRGDIDAQP